MLIELVRTMRPRQWIKNVVVFAALIFAEQTIDLSKVMLAVYAFIIFCFLTGAVYIINDLADLEKDRKHPRKSKRPLAAGRLSIPIAGVAAAVLGVSSLTSAFFLGTRMGLVSLGYFLLQLTYTGFLKDIVIIDVMAVAIGFVLRAVAGAVAIAVPISPWLLVCTILLALFLALGKRRHEIVLLGPEANYHRPILTEYSTALLDQMISVVTASTVVAYCLYTFFSETAHQAPYLMFTIPFVVYGIFRYLYLVHRKGEGGSPEEILLTDKPLIIDVALWLVAVLVIFALR